MTSKIIFQTASINELRESEVQMVKIEHKHIQMMKIEQKLPKNIIVYNKRTGIRYDEYKIENS